MSASAEALGISISQSDKRGGYSRNVLASFANTKVAAPSFSVRVTNSFCIYLLRIMNALRSPSVLLSSCVQMASPAPLESRPWAGTTSTQGVVAAAGGTSGQGPSPQRCIRSNTHKVFFFLVQANLILHFFFFLWISFTKCFSARSFRFALRPRSQFQGLKWILCSWPRSVSNTPQ